MFCRHGNCPHIDTFFLPCFSQGILRIHFLEAQDLLGKDKFLRGLIKGKSDPYGVVQIGNQLFQSKTIKETVNPKWNEVYEVCQACVVRRAFQRKRNL